MNNDLRDRVLIVLSHHHVRLDPERMSALLDDLCALIRTPGISAEGWQPAKNRNQERTRRKNPAPGKRVCATCKKTRSLRVFGMRDGTPKSSCNNCLAEKQRNRYISAKQLAALNAVRLEFVADDEIAGLRCLDCGQVIEAGDEVTAESGLRHTFCAQESTDRKATA